jgi:hypothetical protein
MPSQAAVQQNESMAQIWASHWPHEASSGVPATHGSWQAHAPQSEEQLVHDSLPLHVPSPQTEHAPQSCAQVLHDSCQSQTLSPQTEHVPQSGEQLPHVSPASQIELPQTSGHCWPQTLATWLTQSESHAA